MGLIGSAISSRAVFVVTFLLAIPTLLALSRIKDREIDPERAHGALRRPGGRIASSSVLRLLGQPALLIFAAVVMLLQMANAALLPLMATVVTTKSSQWAPVLIAACIVVPQAIVALASPTVGRLAQRWGRKPLLLIGFSALVARALLFAFVTDPFWLVAVQAFDGVTAAVFGVMVPLIVSDIAFGTGHFNFAQGVVGTATGIGASLSPLIAGYISHGFTSATAFAGMAGIAALGLIVAAAIMPETRPRGTRA